MNEYTIKTVNMPKAERIILVLAELMAAREGATVTDVKVVKT